MASQLASAMQQPASRDLHLEGSELHSSCSHSEDSAAAPPFAQLLSNAASAGGDWKVTHPLARLWLAESRPCRLKASALSIPVIPDAMDPNRYGEP